MSIQDITVRTRSGPNADVPFVVQYDVPDSIQEAIDRFGEDVVYSRFKASLVIDVQGYARSYLTQDGIDADSLQELVSAWQPGAKARGKTTLERAMEMIARLTDEEKERIRARFE